MIGLKVSHQVFSQFGAKLKLLAPHAQFFSRFEQVASNSARNSDWFIALFAPIVIGRSNNFDIEDYDVKKKYC